jgi:hypothetical protein
LPDQERYDAAPSERNGHHQRDGGPALHTHWQLWRVGSRAV